MLKLKRLESGEGSISQDAEGGNLIKVRLIVTPLE